MEKFEYQIITVLAIGFLLVLAILIMSIQKGVL